MTVIKKLRSDFVNSDNYEINDSIENLQQEVIDGAGTLTGKYVAGESLLSQRVVMLENSKALYYDVSDYNSLGKHLGVTYDSALLNEEIRIVQAGLIVNMGWGLTPNAIYYIGVGGILTVSPPSSPAIFQRVGIAVDSNTLRVSFSEPIEI